MKKSPVLLLLTLSFCVKAQTDNKVILGNIDKIHSKILNEDRNIWVYVPNSGSGDIYSKQHYPVVYLLDGDAHFYSVVGMIQQLSSVNGNTFCPEMIVVGIPNRDRTRDLTPTQVNADPPFMDSNFTKTSGGGEKFIEFIERELMPHIDSAYPTEPYKILIGHSFGGLTAMNTLIHHTHLFNAYVVIDPSVWWDHKKLLGETKEALATRQFPNMDVFLGIANTMNPGMDTMKVQKDSSAFTRHIRSMLELNKYFLLNKQNGINYQYKYYNTDDHGSVPLITEYDALHFLFNFYPMKLTPPEQVDPNTAVIIKIEKHYDDISKHFGYKVKIPEAMANSLGYEELAKKKYDEAEYLFKLNTANYPESFNTFDSLGDLYDAKGEKDKALESNKRFLSIKETPDTRKKLEKLQGK
jgi:predicted alpha/beta superfamily hydrolase